MAYKVNGTTVIDDSGNIDWARISGAPAPGLTSGTEFQKEADEWHISGTGDLKTDSYFGIQIDEAAFHDVRTRVWYNCNCNCYC